MTTAPWTEPARRGDVVFFRAGSWFARVIRARTRSRDEGPTMAHHVGVYVEDGPWWDADITEALWRVRRHALREHYGGAGGVMFAIARPTNLSPVALDVIAADACQRIGDRYGFGKLLLHLVDSLLFGGRVVARRIAFTDTPICSYHVARAYRAAGLDFGIVDRYAQPDDMWDFCVAEHDKYTWPLAGRGVLVGGVDGA